MLWNQARVLRGLLRFDRSKATPFADAHVALRPVALVTDQRKSVLETIDSLAARRSGGSRALRDPIATSGLKRRSQVRPARGTSDRGFPRMNTERC